MRYYLHIAALVLAVAVFFLIFSLGDSSAQSLIGLFLSMGGGVLVIASMVVESSNSHATKKYSNIRFGYTPVDPYHERRLIELETEYRETELITKGEQGIKLERFQGAILLPKGDINIESETDFTHILSIESYELPQGVPNGLGYIYATILNRSNLDVTSKKFEVYLSGSTINVLRDSD